MEDILKILTIKDPDEEKILRTVSEPVTLEEIKAEEFQKFLNQLLQTAVSSEDQVGVQSAGISAPQVGRNIKAIYILREGTSDFELLINPEITVTDTKQDIDYEGCLSVPGVEEPVSRYKKVKAVYLDKNGNKKKETFKGLEAREVQHEIDHLNGILFIDRIEE